MKPQPTQTTTERRRGRRVQARLQIELQLEPGSPAHASDTINISANGVYFKSPRFVAPLTKLGLRLLLPDDDGRDQAVACQGIVVRCLPEEPAADVDSYEVACYFTDTSPEFRACVAEYVTRNL
jgi:hypothetical protein